MTTHTPTRPHDDQVRQEHTPADGIPRTCTRVEIALPVHNEAATLARSVRALDAYLEEGPATSPRATPFPFEVEIVIVDSASTDTTFEIARGLERELGRVSVVHVPERGRGRALRAVWATSHADIVAYMDVDLSTDLNALWPLLAPLAAGHSDVAIGTRLARGAHTERGVKREVISRVYNSLLRATCRAGFTDAQCGFKALRRETAARLLPHVENDNWFFDTELLLLAERSGLRIMEVPVDWTDDPDSRVDVPRAILEDLRGIMRVRCRIATGTFHTSGHDPRHDRPRRQLVRFLGVGALCTFGYLVLYAGLARLLPSMAANAFALAIMTVVNTALHRGFTFSIRGRERLVRDHAEAAVVFLLFFALTSAALGVTELLWPDPDLALRLVALGTANLVASLARFAGMRWWVFNPARRSAGPSHTEKERS
ncbi:MAG: glycosyltransferase [Acidimicrobiia bacterium]|nr:glycosyltransferase [Acidimicrobiia bacterium]